MDQAEQGAGRRAGAVGVLAAVDRRGDHPAEIVAALQQGQHGQRDIRRGVVAQASRVETLGAVGGAGPLGQAEEGAAAMVPQDLVARVAPGQPLAVGLHGAADRAGHPAVGGDVRQADLNQLAQVVADEGRTLQGREEHFAPGALAVAVIDDGVLDGVAGRHVGQARRDAGPDLRADERAATVPPVVAPGARPRRRQARTQVHLRRAVLRPVRRHVQAPVLRQRMGGDVEADQPEQLQVQVVVGQRLAAEGLRVEGDVVDLANELKRRAERAADVLAHPAAQDPPAVIVAEWFHAKGSTAARVCRQGFEPTWEGPEQGGGSRQSGGLRPPCSSSPR